MQGTEFINGKEYHNGKRVMTDGGVAAQSGIFGDTLGPAQTPAAQNMANNAVGSRGFAEFAANSALNHAVMTAGEDSQMAQNAATQRDAIRANSTLRKDEYKEIEDAVYEVAQPMLKVVGMLQSRGLTESTDLGTLLHQWETGDEWGDAAVDMGADTEGTAEESVFGLEGTKLPIVHKSFNVKYRHLLASRTRGQSVRTRGVRKATRSVSEGLENMALYGWNPSKPNGVVGLMNHPDANAVSGSDWTDTSGVSADDMRADVLEGIEDLENDNYGPEGTGYVFGMARDAYQSLRARDTGTSKERGLMERLQDEFGDYVQFERFDYLNPGEAVMFKPVQDVIKLVVAADMNVNEWQQKGWSTELKVMASSTPIVRSDENGQCGIAAFSGLSG